MCVWGVGVSHSERLKHAQICYIIYSYIICDSDSISHCSLYIAVHEGNLGVSGNKTKRYSQTGVQLNVQLPYNLLYNLKVLHNYDGELL